MAPFADTDKLFAASQYSGYRFLVVRTAGDSCTGRIVELISKQPTTSDKAAYSVLAGTKPFLAGLAPGPLADFTGALLVYSPSYEYEAGLAYVSGALQPLRMAPGPDTCYDYYLVGYDNTGTQVIHDYLYTTCTGGIPGSSGGWGGATYTGGGGGGANSTLSPTTVLVVPPDTPILDIHEFLKCFDINQSATLTIYVKQPVPGTPATWAGVPPRVGHTFISLAQNGVIRTFGFYPASPRAAVAAVTSVIGDDSQHDYDVSITTTISPSGLNSVLNYTYGSTTNQYSLQHYNCTNFGIDACAQIGLILPDIQGNWEVIFSGSNPGNLGQEMRNMTMPAGATLDVTGGQAPLKSGGC